MRTWFLRASLIAAVAAVAALATAPALAGFTNNIMLTGYWPNTNEMLRGFSQNPAQNPSGWVGADWEARGYNVYSYFPEFPGGSAVNPKGEGDFEVDYQDTSADFWRITAELKPVAIIGFGIADQDHDWEVEGGNKMYGYQFPHPAPYWDADYQDPFRPTSALPIGSQPVGTIHYSSLPLADIVSRVATSGANVNEYSTALDDSRFLCNFMGYHDNWYHDLHSDPNDPAWNVAAGFIHVGSLVNTANGVLATEATLRAVIDYVDSVVPEPTSALALLLLAAIRRR